MRVRRQPDKPRAEIAEEVGCSVSRVYVVLRAPRPPAKKSGGTSKKVAANGGTKKKVAAKR